MRFTLFPSVLYVALCLLLPSALASDDTEEINHDHPYIQNNHLKETRVNELQNRGIPDITTTPGSNSTSTSAGAPTSLSDPRPTPPVGESSTRYAVNDERITWSSGWVTGSSGCTTSAKKTTTGVETFTIMIPSAQQIYLSVNNTNAAYDVYVNGDRTFFSGLQVSEVCAYKQLPPATNSRNINVTAVIYGVLMNGRRQSGGLFDWSFQLNEVLVMDSTSGTSSPGNGGTGSAIGIGVSWFNGVAAMLLAVLGLAF